MQKSSDTAFQWLIDTHDFTLLNIKPLLGDASFRRYYRILGYFEHQSPKSYILMESPKPQEKTEDFIKVSKLLSENHIRVPEIIKMNPSRELLLLEDFGDRLLLDELHASNLSIYYKNALEIIGTIQKAYTKKCELPAFDQNYMQQEMSLFNDWFIEKHLRLTLTFEEKKIIDDTFKHIALTISQHPQTIIHRDFHSRNLMILNHLPLGVIDFQDAMVGPRAYDVVSLLKDCYIVWDEPTQKYWCEYFFQLLKSTDHFETFWEEFNLCGLQRHLKVLGIFCRLYYRDNKDRYLQDLPTVWNYTMNALKKFPCYNSFYELMCKIEPFFVS